MIEWPDLTALWLSFKLAAVTTFLLIVLTTPLAYWLAKTQSKLKPLLETLVALPIVLPPTVMGFYLLILLGPDGWLGSLWVQMTGSALTFSFTGLVIASMVYSLPFVIQPLQNGFESINPTIQDAAKTLGTSSSKVFLKITAPLAKRAFLTAGVLGFAHTLGEFGVILMVGGNIPGKTKVIAIEIYNQVEMLNYSQAHVLSAILLGLAFILIFMVYWINNSKQRVL